MIQGKGWQKGTTMALALTKPNYILIHQDKVHIEYFHKGEDGRWVLTEYKALEDRFRIDSIDMELSLARLYERVEWENNEDSLR